MRCALVLALLASTAAADPGKVETSLEVSGGLAVGNIEENRPMDQRVSSDAVIGLGAGYRVTPRTSAGAYVEYGVGDAYEKPCQVCGFDVLASARVFRMGLYAQQRHGDVIGAVRVGYEQVDVTDVSYSGVGLTTRNSWRGVELLRPEIGCAVYDAPRVSVALFAAVSVGVFEYRDSNGRGQWISNEMSDVSTGTALHGWLMVGTRVGFQAF